MTPSISDHDVPATQLLSSDECAILARVWAASVLETTFNELAHTCDRALEHLPRARPASRMPGSHIVHGLWSLCLLRDAPAILFQIAEDAPDAMIWDEDRRAFTRWSVPGDEVEPLGYLRCQILRALEREIARHA